VSPASGGCFGGFGHFVHDLHFEAAGLGCIAHPKILMVRSMPASRRATSASLLWAEKLARAVAGT
jgi:hypothetical protein